MCGFHVTSGEWTEVPSRKKTKAKREGSELSQEQKTINAPADNLPQVVVVSMLMYYLPQDNIFQR